VRHARSPRRARVALTAAVAGALVIGATAAVTTVLSGGAGGGDASASAASLSLAPPTVATLPVPKVEQAPTSTDICSLPELTAALEARDDAAVIAAAGGGEAFRMAVASGIAPCIDLADPSRVWAVINKVRPFAPVDYRPLGLVQPQGVRTAEGGSLRTDAAAALTVMVAAARTEAAGEVALESGFRSFDAQQRTYGRHVAERGAAADLVSARPGHSEHQSGLAADVVGCAGGCGNFDDFAASPQGQWVAANSWEYGWIVRYVDPGSDVTGYLPEAWHLRYVGPELARAYHEGSWTSLEEFFGLPAAPDYAG
jgi:D-alanyl-D-alanine carboxypeptidase